MPAVTGLQIVRGAFGILKAYGPTELPDAADAQTGLEYLNDLLSEMGQRDCFIPLIARERFSTIVGKGGPENPYTIGPGGDLDTERPSNQNSITAGNLILTATSPEVRINLSIYTDDAYDSNLIPDMSNTQPIGLYYNPTYANDLGSFFLWPVPSVSYNDIELFLQKGLPQFADLSTTVYVPDGVPRLLKYNLADSMQDVMGHELSASAQRIAVSSMGTFKRSNLHLTDAANDAQFAGNRRTLYNINSGQGG